MPLPGPSTTKKTVRRLVPLGNDMQEKAANTPYTAYLTQWRQSDRSWSFHLSQGSPSGAMPIPSVSPGSPGSAIERELGFQETALPFPLSSRRAEIGNESERPRWEGTRDRIETGGGARIFLPPSFSSDGR